MQGRVSRARGTVLFREGACRFFFFFCKRRVVMIGEGVVRLTS